MASINKKIVNNKLAHITSYLGELRPILKLDNRHLLAKKNYRDLRTLERVFQLIVDTMIEINSHLIKSLNLSPADDYTNTFIILGENNILPPEFAAQIARTVGLRNKIIHKYDIIDPKKFINDLKDGSGQFQEYIKYIQSYVNKKSKNK